MTDKVQKIREKVEKLKSQLLRGACSSQIAMETRCKEEAYNDVLAILDTMQEEPAPKIFDDMPLDPNIQYASREIGIKAHAEDYSFNIESELFQQLNKEQQELWRKEIEQACMSGGYCGLNLGLDKRYDKRYDKEEPVSKKKCIFTKDSYTDEDRKVLCDACEEDCEYAQKKEPANNDYENALNSVAVNFMEAQGITPNLYAEQIIRAVKHGAQWQEKRLLPMIDKICGMCQKQQDFINAKDLGELISTLSRRYPEVSFAKLSRIAVRVAKWQKQQFEKDCADLCNGIATAKGIAVAMAYDKGMADAREQMMAKAIDGDITFDYYGDDDKTYGCIAHDSFCLEDFGLKDRDKVKVIVIKED